MRHLDLFSGIGGFALAAEWSGFETAMFCEIDPFCREVLRKHWPHVPIHDDIRTLTADVVGQPIDLLTGGFPCQPFSVAGKRRGSEDDRHLWPEMARLIGECRPRWVLGENTPGLISLGIDDCLADLEGLGYEAWPVVVPACAVGAWHPRARVWIVAHATDGGIRRGRPSWQAGLSAQLREDVSDASGVLRFAVIGEQSDGTLRSFGQERVTADTTRFTEREPADEAHAEPTGRHTRKVPGGGDWWRTEPGVRGVAHGIPGRVDRLKSLGNAIVPQVAYVILSAMLEAEAAQWMA